MKTTEEMIEVMRAIRERADRGGSRIETAGPACDDIIAMIDAALPAPKPAPTQDTIPWDAIDERFKWVARDADGSVYGYSAPPHRRDTEWRGLDAQRISHIVKIIPGTIDWRESLQQRPAAEEKTP